MGNPRPFSVLFVPVSTKLFHTPHRDDAGLDSSEDYELEEMYLDGAKRHHNAGVLALETLLETITSSGCGAHETNLIELGMVLGNTENLQQKQGSLAICRCSDDELLRKLWERARGLQIGPEQLELIQFCVEGQKYSPVTLDERFAPPRDSGPTHG